MTRTPPFLKPQTVGNVIDDLTKGVPAEEWTKLPKDFASSKPSTLRDRRAELQVMADELADIAEMLEQCRKAGHQPRSVDVSRAASIQHRIAKLASE